MQKTSSTLPLHNGLTKTRYSNQNVLSIESFASSSRLSGHFFLRFLFHFKHFAPVFVSFTNNLNAGVHGNLFFVSVERRKNSKSEIYLETVNTSLEMARLC